MDALTLRAGMRLNDSDFPARVERLCFLARVRDGKQYDHLGYPFASERNDNGEYIKIADRRPSARTGLCRVVVNDSVSLLFGEGRFPMVTAKKAKLRANIKALIAETRLGEVMNAAAVHGSIGSVAIIMRILNGRVFFEIMDTTYMTPIWRPDAPDTLGKVVERYKVDAAQLKAAGYTVADGGRYWFQRTWDDNAETWFLPQSLTDAAAGKPMVEDADKTVEHKLGFVPIVWIKNLPTSDKTDGDCTFEAAISTVMEMDYQLSQAGRGLKYASDPTLLIKEPALGGGSVVVRSASEALVVSENGDAKLLEINGTAAAAVIDYVRTLREAALEAMRGNRTNVDKLNGAQSGRALEMMNQGLIWLADQMRITYGQNGLLALIRMVCDASRKVPIEIGGKSAGAMDGADISLVWPRYFPPTYDEKFQEAQAYSGLVNAGLIAKKTAIGKMAADNDVEDVDQEMRDIEGDQKAFDERAARQAAQVQVKENE